MKLHEIMTTKVEVARPDSTLRAVAQTMKSVNVGMVPVCDGDRVLGALTDRDIAIRAVAEGKDPNTTKAADVMTADITYCYEDDDVKDAAKKMQEEKIRRLIVINKDKRLVGIVSLGDLAVDMDDDKKAGQVLEKISAPSEPKR